MITISCGTQNAHRMAKRFDWQRYLNNNEERTYVYADLLQFLDWNNCKVFITAEGYDRFKSLFIQKFIEPYIGEDGYVRDCEPDYAYWPMPDGSTRSVLYCIHQYHDENPAHTHGEKLIEDGLM